jgi:hypothetical protein
LAQQKKPGAYLFKPSLTRGATTQETAVLAKNTYNILLKLKSTLLTQFEK